GNTGFKGSWLSLWLYRRGAQVRGYSLRPPTVPSMFKRCRLEKLYRTVTADVRDYGTLKPELASFKPDIVFHLAAQPLVLQSYKSPLLTYATNVLGTANLLEAALHVPSVKAVINVTSDKCYANSGRSRRFVETDRLGGSDPYSSSKACAELVSAAYLASFYSNSEGKGLASARAGNVIGGGDWAADRLLPDFFRAAQKTETLLLRNPEHIRPWQHVLEPLRGYLLLGEKLFRNPSRYHGGWNFGPIRSDCRSVREVIALAASHWGKSAKYRAATSPVRHEAPRLELDAGKAAAKLGWKPKWRLETAICKTVDWHKASLEGRDMLDYTLTQIAEYEDR
ncbi:MAG TPA: CDP-glucose 4,6-dehydratase, partial [Elusimicrobiales bacterium]|nr:CDP-glucose 4,6-dehydratase [Elusimicrobiales bacterium]